MSSTQVSVAPSAVPAGSVPEGKVSDYVMSRLFRDTPEEYVRQNIAKALVRQYLYDPKDCDPEFPIKVGSSRKRVDIVIFHPGAEHRQENARSNVAVLMVRPGWVDVAVDDMAGGRVQEVVEIRPCVSVRTQLGEACDVLALLYAWADSGDIPEMRRFAGTVRRWENEVLAYFTTGGASNGPTERST